MTRTRSTTNQRRTARSVGGLLAALFILLATLQICGALAIDETALGLILASVASLIFGFADMLGVTKVSSGSLELELQSELDALAPALRVGEIKAIRKVIGEHSELFPVSGVRVLWVDNHHEKLIAHRRLLRRLGFVVVAVPDTASAKTELNRDGDFALIIQDQRRPDPLPEGGRIFGDAVDLVDWVVTQDGESRAGPLHDIPVVVFTWDAQKAEEISIRDEHFVSRDPARLLDVVAEVVDESISRGTGTGAKSPA